MSEGEASQEDRLHVASCAVCTARLRQLQEDLRRLTAVLGEAPPRQAVRSPSWSAGRPWLSATAGLAAVLMVVWVGLWQQFVFPRLTMEASQESIGSFFEGVAAALSGAVDGEAAGTSELLASLDDLQAALVGDWPCDDAAFFVAMACTDDTATLLLGEL
jgi:hypothetical protein